MKMTFCIVVIFPLVVNSTRPDLTLYNATKGGNGKCPSPHWH